MQSPEYININPRSGCMGITEPREFLVAGLRLYKTGRRIPFNTSGPIDFFSGPPKRHTWKMGFSVEHTSPDVTAAKGGITC